MHLVELLVDAKTSLVMFLQQATSLLDRLLLDPELLHVTTLLKQDVTIASVLFEKYQTLWTHYTNGTEPVRMQQLFSIGWMLVISIKRHVPIVFVGLGSLYFLVLAVLELLCVPHDPSKPK